jgi:hypothetical protein
LKRIDLGGGQPQNLAEVLNAATVQGAWSEQGVILFTTSVASALFRVPASGGQAVAVTKLEKGQISHRAPRFLPGGKQFLFTSIDTDPGLWLGSLNAGEPRRISGIAAGTESVGEYLAPGWLVRVRGNVLVAQRFDASRGQLSGDPVALAQGVGLDQNSQAGSGVRHESWQIAVFFFCPLTPCVLDTLGTGGNSRCPSLFPISNHAAPHSSANSAVWVISAADRFPAPVAAAANQTAVVTGPVSPLMARMRG